ncbi:hypothetical protein ACW0KB_20695 [Virgibacillus salarius]
MFVTIYFYDGLETDTMILVKEGNSFRFAPYKEQGELKLLYAPYVFPNGNNVSQK